MSQPKAGEAEYIKTTIKNAKGDHFKLILTRLFADYTKIWRLIINKVDITQIQSDINNLHIWFKNDKIIVHPYECKLSTMKHKPCPLEMLHFVSYRYHLTENLLSYAINASDLGIRTV